MKIKIAHIQLLPIMSGVQKISYSIFKGLDTDEYDVHLICSDDPYKREESLINKAEALGVKVHVIKHLKREISLKDISVFKQVRKICKEENFDIVHTHTTKMGFIGRLAAKSAGIKKVIHTLHGIAFHPFESKPKRVLYFLCEVLSSFFCDKHVLVNRGYRKTFWFTLRNLITIYNGISFADLQVKEVYGNELKLIFIGRLDSQKDPLTLLKAINLVKIQGYSIEAKLVGDGELMKQCMEFVNKKGLNEMVELCGWRDDISNLLAESNVFCSSSLYEALPLSFLEAGYSGLTTIGTDIIGVREVVVKDTTGYLFNTKDYVKLSELLVRLIEKPELIENMGRNAHKFVKENFQEERMIEEYLELYRNI